MRSIKRLVCRIDDEIKGAEKYAEDYIEAKAYGGSMSSKYKEMAEDELKHATYLHDKAAEDITKLKTVYKPPLDMLDKWERTHDKYINKVTEIKRILAM